MRGGVQSAQRRLDLDGVRQRHTQLERRRQKGAAGRGRTGGDAGALGGRAMRAIGMVGALPCRAGGVVAFLVATTWLHDVELRCAMPGAVATLSGRSHGIQAGREAHDDHEQPGHAT